MQYPVSLSEGWLVRRYQRFLGEVLWPEGETEVVHVPNTGSLAGCIEPDQPARLARENGASRRYPCRLEQLLHRGGWVGVNPQRANGLFSEALDVGLFPEWGGLWTSRRSEVPYGQEKSRIDWLLGSDHEAQRFVEVKSVSASFEPGLAEFPDSPSERALKHLRELRRLAAAGKKAALVFCVQRSDVSAVAPADRVDPRYRQGLQEAIQAGVEVVAFAVDARADALVPVVRLGVQV